MSDANHDWHAVLASSRFRLIARRRRTAVIVLGLSAAAYYFAIPAVIAWAPHWFNIRIASGINLGVLFALSQYPVGLLIGLIFVRRMAALDREKQAIANSSLVPTVIEGERHAY